MNKKVFGKKHKKRLSTMNQPTTRNETIESALQLQRQIFANVPTPEMRIDNLIKKDQKMSGYQYDAETDRYYKYHKTHEIATRILTPTKTESHIIRNRTVRTLSLPQSLYERSLLCYSAPAKAMSLSLLSNHINLKPSRSASFEGGVDASFHPSFGLAIAHSKSISFDPEHWKYGNIAIEGRWTVKFLRFRPGIGFGDRQLIACGMANGSTGEALVDIYSGCRLSSGGGHSLVYRRVYPNDELLVMEWTEKGSLFVGTETHCSEVNSQFQSHFAEAATDGLITSISNRQHVYYMGQRNGSLLSRDVRCKAAAVRIGWMPFCVDHICALNDDRTLVCMDKTAGVRLYDVRFPGVKKTQKVPPNSYHDGSSLVLVDSDQRAPLRSRRFWLSPNEDLIAFSSPYVERENTISAKSKTPRVVDLGVRGEVLALHHIRPDTTGCDRDKSMPVAFHTITGAATAQDGEGIRDRYNDNNSADEVVATSATEACWCKMVDSRCCVYDGDAAPSSRDDPWMGLSFVSYSLQTSNGVFASKVFDVIS